MDKEPLPVFVFGCVSCGKTVAGTEKSCPRCGASFEDVKFECPFCGEFISPTQRKCETCGTEFSEFAEGVSEMSTVDLDNAERVTAQEPAKAAPKSADSSEVVEFECPNCGKPVSEMDTECPNCGARFA
jgi:DNA-directed RNA polymerase subunit RPC12/RpoP